MAVSDAQRKASAKWDKNNAERKKYIQARSACKRFILAIAEDEDLELVEEWLKQRKNN